MPDASACLLDSNILLRMSKGDDPYYAVIRGALHVLVAQGSRLCFTSQTLGEFCAFCRTRGMSVELIQCVVRSSGTRPKFPVFREALQIMFA